MFPEDTLLKLLTPFSHNICLTLFLPRAATSPWIPALMGGGLNRSGREGLSSLGSDWLLAILHLKSATCCLADLADRPRHSLLHSPQQ